MMSEDDGVLEKALGTKIEWKAGGLLNHGQPRCN